MSVNPTDARSSAVDAGARGEGAKAAVLDEEDRRWLSEVYQGDGARQLTVRAVVTGMLIGAVMSVSNLYVGLKTGWGLGVTITACIVAYAVFRALEAAVPSIRRVPFTLLENNMMSSAASAAGYMSSAGLVSAIPALYLTTGRSLRFWEMMPWLAAVSVLGVFMAVPLKRQLINHDKLAFPSGIATAATLRSMHEHGGGAAIQARSLLAAAIAGAAIAFWRDAPLLAGVAIPSTFALIPGAAGQRLLSRLTFGWEGSTIMLAAGAIMGIRVGVSLLVGAVVFFGVIGERVVAAGVAQPGYKGIVAWTLWPATAMMLTSSLTSLAMGWRTIGRAFSGMARLFRRRGAAAADPLARVEVPGSWVLAGTLLSGAVCVVLGHLFFDVKWWMGLIAVLATFVLSIVAARATGETDITPVGAMGKLTQLIYGVVSPSNITTNLMTASITAGAASHAGDLLTDLKSGYLLGANPRKQTIAQLFGVLSGTLLCVPVYAIVAVPEKLGTAELPAPAAKVWAGVAEMLAQGPSALPAGTGWAMAIGGSIGVLIPLAERYVPERHHAFIPSATGLGIAGVIPAFNSLSMFLGALIAWILSKRAAALHDRYVIPVSSGLIAGESLMGVAILLYLEGPALIRQLFGP